MHVADVRGTLPRNSSGCSNFIIAPRQMGTFEWEICEIQIHNNLIWLCKIIKCRQSALCADPVQPKYELTSLLSHRPQDQSK